MLVMHNLMYSLDVHIISEIVLTYVLLQIFVKLNKLKVMHHTLLHCIVELLHIFRQPSLLV